MKDTIFVFQTQSSAWDSHMDDNLKNALLIDWSRKIGLKGTETSIVCLEALKKSGRLFQAGKGLLR